ncbi:MAG: M81 family metallopeptidase [Candidatus Sulfotelmatobacter sp.]
MKRVGVLGFLHESNTFLNSPTTYQLFESTSMTRGQELIERWRGTHHELGGFLVGAEESGFSIVPCMATYAVPAGAIPTADYERLTHELIDTVRRAMPLDGLLVALHGATASERFPDADGEFLQRLRTSVGNDLPVIVTLDLHANVSPRMIALSTATIIYRSNPHLDQQERGREAARLLGRILSGEVEPVQAVETPPMLVEIACQHTSEQPAEGLYDDLREVLTWPGILSASVAMGFCYADVEEMGVAFVAVANRDIDLARRATRWMARRAWERREEFVANLPDVEAAVRNAAASTRRPVVLMDVGDNAGAGSPADSTILFAEILAQGVRNALVVLYDPESVEACLRAGIRSDVEVNVGGKTDQLHGNPIRIRGRVRTISDGCFVETEARHGGWGASDQGITVVVETAEDHTIVLTSNRMPPLSLEQVLSLGIHPERKALIVVKGVVAPRAAYEPVAGEIVLVDTPGVTANNPRLFSYLNRRRPLFPLERDAAYSQA